MRKPPALPDVSLKLERRSKSVRKKPWQAGPGLLFLKETVYTESSGMENQEDPMHRPLILFGVLLILVGVAWPWLSKLPFGRLPGDIIVERENFRFYFPLTTGLLLSVVLSLLLWWWHRK
jgi:hypothetical protein